MKPMFYAMIFFNKLFVKKLRPSYKTGRYLNKYSELVSLNYFMPFHELI